MENENQELELEVEMGALSFTLISSRLDINHAITLWHRDSAVSSRGNMLPPAVAAHRDHRSGNGHWNGRFIIICLISGHTDG